MNVERVLYLADSLRKRALSVDMACPNCGSKRSRTLDRKFMVVELRRCHDCRLMYRVPTDSVTQNRSFYQKRYTEGFTTELPTDGGLEHMKATRFAGTEKSYDYYIAVLKALGLSERARVFDYGCSWGYGSWQLRQAGFDVVSYEISEPRAAFARQKLGVDCVKPMPNESELGNLAHAFDAFFSAHVLEHVPQPAQTLKLARALVKQGGYMVIFTPNGSLSHREQHSRNWHTGWGKVHPFMIDEEYYRSALADQLLLLAGSPVDLDNVAAFAAGRAEAVPSLIGDELLCVSRC